METQITYKMIFYFIYMQVYIKIKALPILTIYYSISHQQRMPVFL